MSKELEAFLEYITVTKALSKATIKAYESDLTLIENTLKKPLISLDNKTLLHLFSQIENSRTLNRKLSATNSFFDFCHRSHFNSDQSKFELAKIPKNLPKFLSFDQVMAAIDTINRDSAIGKRDYALILFLYATGMRISEALAIRNDDFEGDWIRVRSGKGEKERYVPIAKNARGAIDEYIHARDFESEVIWCNYQRKSLSRISAFKITQKYLGVSPHVLRHSYATALILGGADLRVVQELLGHSSLLTTQIYTHLQKQNLSDTLRRYHPLSKESK